MDRSNAMIVALHPVPISSTCAHPIPNITVEFDVTSPTPTQPYEALAYYNLNHSNTNDISTAKIDHDKGDIYINAGGYPCIKIFFTLLPASVKEGYIFEQTDLVRGGGNFGAAKIISPSQFSVNFQAHVDLNDAGDPFTIHVFNGTSKNYANSNNYAIDPHVHNTGPPNNYVLLAILIISGVLLTLGVIFRALLRRAISFVRREWFRLKS